MNKKHFSWLLVLTVVVAAVILLMPGPTGQESMFEVEPLLPGLKEEVNEIDRVRIVAAGNQEVISMVRTDDAWVEETHSYPADWSRLKTLLAELAQAQVIELKTRNPEYFGRLGLSGVDSSDSKAVLVELEGGNSPYRILVGNTAQEREGHYLRLADSDQAVLIDRTLVVPRQPSEWLESEIIDIAADEVVEATITHRDGEVVSIRKVSADDEDFSLQQVPEGREAQSAWVVNALGGMLSNLNLQQVVPVDEVDWSEAVNLRVLTADGVEVQARLASVDGGNWLRLEALPYQGIAENGVSRAVADDTMERVDTINRRVAGWAYSLTDNQALQMKKRMDDLLKAESES